MAVKTYALTTRQRLIDFLSLGTISDTTVQNVLDRIIDVTTELIENYIGFRVLQTAYTNEIYDTEKSDILLLKNYPVNSGSAFTLQRRNSSLNEDSWETIDSQYYVVDYNEGIIHGMGGWTFQRTRAGYRVTYTAGFNYDNAATFLSETAGGDLELAAWLVAGAIYQSRKGGSLGVQSERIGDYSVTFRKALLENEDLQNILDKYRRHEAASYLTPINV